MNTNHYKRISISFFDKVMLESNNKSMKDKLYSEIYQYVLIPEIANVSCDDFEQLTDTLYVYWKNGVIDFDLILNTLENKLSSIKGTPKIKRSRSTLLSMLD